MQHGYKKPPRSFDGSTPNRQAPASPATTDASRPVTNTGAVPERMPVFLIAGETCVRQAPAQLTSVLGSCISVCLWCARARIGGMNHYMMPRCTPEDRTPLRGDIATERLLQQLAAAGVASSHLVAKIFGGASSSRLNWNAGAENILVAWDAMARARVPIVAADVGGQRGRHITFDVSTGLIHVRYLKDLDSFGNAP